MPTDAGVVTRAEVNKGFVTREMAKDIREGTSYSTEWPRGWRNESLNQSLCDTIEQFADALRRVLINPDPPCWSNEHCPCANCNARRLLAAYDARPVDS